MLLSHMPLQTSSLTLPPSVPDHISPASFETMQTTSATYTESSLPAFAPTAAKRPKLSLNTRSLPSSFGQRTTSLRLETLSATSPTARNTFQNATQYGSQSSEPSKLQRPTLQPLLVDADQNSTTQPTELGDTSPSTSSSASTSESSAKQVPYTLPYSIKSALSNSPIERARTSKSSFALRRPMFPAAKRVIFRTPLTEEIVTTRFTMRHSDIPSTNSSISTLELSPAQKCHESKATDVNAQDDTLKVRDADSASPRTGDKRDSSDEEDDESCAATPIAGRQKRHRQWVWTLSPARISQQESTTDARTGSLAKGDTKKIDRNEL